jgi:RES domain-containing protein
LHVWRLCRKIHAAKAYDGAGAARSGARWNSRNVTVAYAAESRSLAMLEYLVHVQRENAPSDLVFVEAIVPDDEIATLDAGALPRNWRREPPPRALRSLGDRWVASRSGLALRVPSAVVPEESNLMINPAHARFQSVKTLAAVRAVVDPRLL